MDDKKIKMDLDQIAKGNVGGVAQAPEIPAEMKKFLAGILDEGGYVAFDNEEKENVINIMYIK